jgi:hypothetical protein
MTFRYWWHIQASTLTFVRLSGTSENWRRTSRSCITVVRRDKWKKSDSQTCRYNGQIYFHWRVTLNIFYFRVSEMCQSCQTWPANLAQILLRTDTRLVFCNRKIMRTDIFFTRTTKPICICNFVKPVIVIQNKTNR